MKNKTLAFAMAFTMILGVTGCGSSEKTVDDANLESYSLYFDIDFDQNIMLATYDVDLYVDDEKISTLPHGEYYTGITELTEGEHTLKFTESGEDSPKEETEITLDADSTFYCNLHTNSDSIELNDKNFYSDITGHELTVPNLEGMVLSDALTSLRDAGFINVDYEAENDTIIDTDNWVVNAQSIAENTVADKNDAIVLTCGRPEAETDSITDSADGEEEITTTVEQTEEETESTTEEEVILTVDNCPELAAILSNKSDNDPSYTEFAEKYKGQTIQFDGYIADVQNYDNYDTRYDILIYAYADDLSSTVGPNFKFENVNIIEMNSDDDVRENDNVTITATVDRFEESSLLFFLKPVSVVHR